MPQYIQFDENGFVTSVVASETAPTHANQYEIEDAHELVGKVYHNGSFYPPKVVADTEQVGIAVTLGEKVSG